MKWLPETWSRTNPFRSKNWMTTRGLMAGSLGILEVEGGNQCFVVGWDWLLVFPEALDVAGHGVLRHFPGFGERPTVSDAPRQRRHQGSESTLRLGPEDNVEMVVRFPHRTCPLYPNS